MVWFHSKVARPVVRGLLFSASLLTSCGNEGDSDTSNAVTPPPVPSVTDGLDGRVAQLAKSLVPDDHCRQRR